MSVYSFTAPAGEVRFEQHDLSRIGSGAVSDVYRLKLSGPDGVAIKIYKDASAVDWERIRKLVEIGARIEKKSFESRAHFAFPRAIVFSGGIPAGICLSLFRQPEYISLGSWIEFPLLNKLGEQLDNLSYRLMIISNLADAISLLHVNDIAIIDLKPANILVEVSTGRLAILDADSFGFIDEFGQKSRPTHVSAEYIDPTSYANELDVGALWKEQDLYALGVINFQLLNYGVHPYQCVAVGSVDLPSTNDEKARAALFAYGVISREGIAPVSVSVHATWPTGIRLLFDRTFLPGKKRPSASEWRAEVRGILDGKELSRCTLFPKDPRHIHFLDRSCCRCALSAARARNASQTPPRRKHGGFAAPTLEAPHRISAATDSGSSWGFIIFLILIVVVILVGSNVR
jgi:serine/threonine protein kinase